MHCTRAGVGATIKLVFILSLFGLFLKLFGIVQVQEYMREGVVVEVSKIPHPDGVPAPQFTFCPLNPITGYGWKSNFSECAGNQSLLECITSCGKNQSIKDCRTLAFKNCYDNLSIKDCIFDNYFSPNEFTLNESQWKQSTSVNFIEEITAYSTGKCLTLQPKSSLKLNAIIGKSNIIMPLKKHYWYSVYIYDPRFFFLSENPVANSGLSIALNNLEDIIYSILFKIEIIQHEKLNRKGQPCVEDEAYSFGECLQLFLETKVNCRLPWNEQRYGKGSMKTCNTWNEFRSFEVVYEEFKLSELNHIVNMTGCLTPCRYREIKEVGTPTETFQNGSDWVYIGPTLISTNIRIDREKLRVPFTTLIGNIGGTLGLFLGFSFMMFWDWIEWAYKFLKSHCSRPE